MNDTDEKLIAEQYKEVLNEQPVQKNPHAAAQYSQVEPWQAAGYEDAASFAADKNAMIPGYKSTEAWRAAGGGNAPVGNPALVPGAPGMPGGPGGPNDPSLLRRGGQLLGQAGQGMAKWYGGLSPLAQGALGLGGAALAAKGLWNTIKDSAKKEGKVLTEDETMEQVVAKLNLMTEDEMNAFTKELGDDTDIDHDFNIGDAVRLSDEIGGGLGEITEISEDGEGSFAVVELMQDQPDAESEASTAERGDNMSVHMSELEPAHDNNVFEDSFDVAANNLYMKYIYR